eukprot:12109359-Alexandrium_andersonii.AAC.1
MVVTACGVSGPCTRPPEQRRRVHEGHRAQRHEPGAGCESVGYQHGVQAVGCGDSAGHEAE